MRTGRTEGRRSIAEAAATLGERERYVDFLRALSIGVVVIGHWLMAAVTYQDGRFGGRNALEQVSGLWVLTWVLQVMPLFFFVGGFSNLRAWTSARARGGGYASFISSRLDRLMRPTAVFVGVWMIAAVALAGIGVRGEGLATGIAIVAKPLWFLAVYVLVVALAPVMISLHQRFGMRVPVALAAATVAVDALRLGAGVGVVGVLNFAFVWLFAHQLGFFYADGTLLRRSRAFFAGAAALGLGALVAATASGIYSPSMVGVATGKASNNSPPSMCLVALTVWLAGLAMLARPRVARMLERPRAWTAVVAANSMIMTVFLWHLTALLLVAPVALPLGFPQPAAGSAGWWLTRPLWIGLLAVVLAVLVAGFARFERRALMQARPASAPHPAAATAAAALIVLALAGFAAFGFSGIERLGWLRPLPSALSLGAGLALLRRR